MWRSLFIGSLLGTVLLAGCNTDDNADTLDNETPMQELRNGANDVRNGVNDVIEDTVPGNNNGTVNPNNSTVPGNGVNDGTINNGVNNGTEEYVAPNGTVEQKPTTNKNGTVEQKTTTEKNVQ